MGCGVRLLKLLADNFFKAIIKCSAPKFSLANASASYSFFLDKIFIAKPIIIEIGLYSIPKAMIPIWKLGSLTPKACDKEGTFRNSEIRKKVSPV